MEAGHEDESDGNLSHRHLDASLNKEGLMAASIDWKKKETHMGGGQPRLNLNYNLNLVLKLRLN